MVFGLALSLGAFILISQPPQNPDQLNSGLLLFAFSFLILVTVWYNYSTIMAVLPIETRGLVLLNLILLFVVAIEPYLLNVVASSPYGAVAEAASVLYAIDLAGMNALLGGFFQVLTREEKPFLAAPAIRRMRISRNFMFGSAVFFAFTALPGFWTWTWFPGMPSRVVLWILTLPAGWVMRLLRK